MALQALTKAHPITTIAELNKCSRTTVYKQQDIALDAIQRTFDPNETAVLFNFPVSKQTIKQVVAALLLACKSSYRDVICFLESIFDYSISIGNISSIHDELCEKAKIINQSYSFESIKMSAADEVFQRNKPILAVVDIPSRFCSLLVKAQRRDYETWAIHLLDMNKQGYAPDTAIIDSAMGLTKGYEVALPNTHIRHDHFHFLRDLKNCARFLRNQENSMVTEVLKLLGNHEKAIDPNKKKKLKKTFDLAFFKLEALEKSRRTFNILVGWLQHDVLQLAGLEPQDRAGLYDFISSEMTVLAQNYPHRIQSIVASLKKRKDALLDVVNTLNEEFKKIAETYSLSIKTIWAVCYTARYSMDSPKYAVKLWELQSLIGDPYDAVEDSVLAILEGTHRCSSMVENFNSRLRPYLDERKEITQKKLDLIMFYLNHKPFMRSLHARLVNKSPAEALTGKEHESWIEMLGFTKFRSQAA
jgi:hypothetical protein